MFYFSTLLGLGLAYEPLELFLWSLVGLVPAIATVALGGDRLRLRPFVNRELGWVWNLLFIGGGLALVVSFIWLIVDQPVIITPFLAVVLFAVVYYPWRDSRRKQV